VANGGYGSTYRDRYFYDVASDGTNIYFGPYYGYYGGISKCPIGGGSCSVAVPYDEIYPGHNYYTYGLGVDDNYIYRAAYSYDAVEVHDKSDGDWAKSLGPMPYDSWMEMPSIDLSDVVSATLTFDHSWGFYYMYEGAYLEISTDGGNEYEQVMDFTKGGYYGQEMSTSYSNPYGGMKGWTYYSFGNSGDMYRKTTSGYKWGSVELDLADYAGFDDVRLRWRVGYCTYWYQYYNGWYRLDNVKVDLLTKDTIFMSETETIGSLAFKESTNVDFPDFQPSLNGLKVGDVVGMLINVVNDYGDEDIVNNRWAGFREVKYVIFADNFEDGDISDWDTTYDQGSTTNAWDASDTYVKSGNYAMFSGLKIDQGYPGSSAATTPTLDLSLPVEATLSYTHAYTFYYSYDGLLL